MSPQVHNNLTANSLTAAVPLNEAGKPRRVGVEIEFAGPLLDDVAALVAGVFGGSVIHDTDYEKRIPTPDLGEFRVEVDVSLLKRLGQERVARPDEPNALEQWSEEMLATLVQQWMPLEVVTPPLPMERLGELDHLVLRLGELGGEGTDAALFYAFGTHFNPEVISTKPNHLLTVLQAFVLLYDWLKRELQVDTMRRLSPFINPFPAAYVRFILAPDYRPGLARLMDDYLRFNPTRNRALDMLPLFAWLDEARVREAVPDPLIKPRPTYHYRLSNSRVGDAHWRLTDEWRYWLVVEALANNPDKLKAMAADYLALAQRPLGDLFSVWVDKTEQWLNLTPNH